MSTEHLHPPSDGGNGTASLYHASAASLVAPNPAPGTPALQPSLSSTPRVSQYGVPGTPDPDTGAPLLASSEALAPNTASGFNNSSAGPYGDKEAAAADAAPVTRSYGKRPIWKRPLFWLGAFIALAVVVLAVVLPVWFVVVKPNRDGGSSSSSSSSKQSSSNPESPSGAVTGGNGSTIVTEDGTSFTYINQFGGFWVSDPKNPFNDSAQPNSWTPPLDQPWTWGVDHIYGVNIGGLFELEPFITPALYEETGAVDEWTLSTALIANNSLQQTLENHYATFITEQDIAQIAGAGLNWIRLPIPFWAIQTWSDVGLNATSGTQVAEPFLSQVCWKYILRLLGWARKYGLRVELDLHTIPGSQNGYNHSGRLGSVNFLNGVMGVANAQRALDYIRTLTEFISQSEYQNLIPVFGIVNEALLTTIGKDQLTTFYLHAHDMIRNITGIGEGHGPYIAIHDGFVGTASWQGFLQGSDRIILDTHPYFAFDGQPNDAPIDIPATGGNGTSLLGGQWPAQACNAWGPGMNISRVNFGVTMAGEFSNGFNDCGYFVEGAGLLPHAAGNCTMWQDWESWTEETKQGLMAFSMASMDALGDWFFWTWKIAPSSITNTIRAPQWSYQLGLENGWIPTDPRVAIGTCESVGVAPQPFNGTFASWATGGAGAGQIAATSIEQFGQFPPATISNVPAASLGLLPSYTTAAPIITLPPLSLSAAATASAGSGWDDVSDTAQFVTTIGGCGYPDAWDAVNAQVPLSGCGATGAAAAPTPPAAAPTPPAAVPATSAPAAVPTTSAHSATSAPLAATTAARR
ncbi:glycoside hydrolase family 5 protein [Gelatoporia subvermispora B]|uniref:glucan 1,3-beta-glucosidase n=1 Tax=Ceriporiopsis subvermispora (strain B) TaxID=914234 RepID=M2R405_CERS8|nr:glycoside hydrolase family 5 protein [Gelatoporia subvermispora B]